ncbi:hypothetical protein P3X46_010349 [Hevea brasiliensis]|uniref:Uncharacterized protein n=1 Tax=Hevea brasiliensis TaxID=3981 RepID=A0ABQ9MFU2_HEVBR|nr:hypothetical protein P3X46_010349 [Hevea brasiliensis]
MAPPQGLAVEVLRSKRKVSIPPEVRASAAEEPAGPPPTTATRSFRPESSLVGEEEAVIERVGRFEWAHSEEVVVFSGDRKHG